MLLRKTYLVRVYEKSKIYTQTFVYDFDKQGEYEYPEDVLKVNNPKIQRVEYIGYYDALGRLIPVDNWV